MARFIQRNRRTRPRGAQEKNKTDDFSLNGRLVTVTDSTSAASEAYRALRTNLLYSVVDKSLKIVIFTSPNQAEGKSTTCANLSVVLVQAAKRTLLVDCDLRKPVLHKFFRLRNT